MRIRLSILILVTCVAVVRIAGATPQTPDLVIQGGVTNDLITNPLEQYLRQGKELPWEHERRIHNTACLRGYRATFEIKDSKLYLLRIESLGYYKPIKWWEFRKKWKIKKRNKSSPWHEIPLREVFPDAKHAVFAEWYSGTLIINQGELLEYSHAAYASICEREITIEIENGLVKKTETIDNTEAYKLKESEKDSNHHLQPTPLNADDEVNTQSGAAEI